jgi:putative Holliday junction resolvase
MRVLGLDVGQRRIGVAVSDPLGLTAQRLTVLQRGGSREDVAAVCALIMQHQAEAVVVGLPLTLKGTHGPQAQRVASFAQALQQQSPVPVHLVDERLTTAQGERALLATGTLRRRRKQVIDQVAAQLILQQYLDSQPHDA